MLGAATEPAPHAGPVKTASSGRAAALVTAGIILSKLTGLLRQRLVAHYFGISLDADMIAAAFRVGNILQNLLGEGTLSASFIPIYARLRAEGRAREATHFALAALGLLLVVVMAGVSAGVLFARPLTALIAAGFDPSALDGTARLVRVLFPMTGLLVLSAWGLGVLNAHRHFFLPYAAPVAWSLAQIGGLVLFGTFLAERGPELAEALALSAVVGAALQLLILLPTARALLGGLVPRFDREDVHVREAARRLPAALLGRGVIQISGLVDTALVSFLGAGAVAAFTNAQVVYLLPMSLLGTGEAAVALPELASEAAAGDRAARSLALRRRLGASLARVTVLTVPVTIAFLVLGRELIALLLQGGSFDAAATARVEPLLMAYGMALLGNAAGRVLTTMAYAIGDTATPARYAVVRVLASTVVSLALMQFFGVIGVVLGAVAAAWVETFALGYKLRAQLGGGLGLEAVPLGRALVLGVFAVAPASLLRAALPSPFAASRLGALVILSVFGVAFSIAAPALGLFDVRALILRRLGPRR